MQTSKYNLPDGVSMSDVKKWAREEAYIECTGCDENPDGCGWVDHDDEQVDIVALYLEESV